MTVRGTSRRAVGAAVALVALAGLAGCAQESGANEQVAGQNFQSGDGSVQTWDAGDREGPVTITGTDFEGGAVDTAGWAGDVVVLNTWYAGCAPCRSEAPGLVGLAEAYADQGVRFLGINTEDEAPTAQAFQRTYSVPYPSVPDRSGEVMANLSGIVPIQATPSTVVLDGEGRVAARVVGEVEASTLEALIEDVLAEEA